MVVSEFDSHSGYMFTLDYQPIDCKTVLEQSTPADPLPDNRTGQFTLIIPTLN